MGYTLALHVGVTRGGLKNAIYSSLASAIMRSGVSMSLGSQPCSKLTVYTRMMAAGVMGVPPNRSAAMEFRTRAKRDRASAPMNCTQTRRRRHHSHRRHKHWRTTRHVRAPQRFVDGLQEPPQLKPLQCPMSHPPSPLHVAHTYTHTHTYTHGFRVIQHAHTRTHASRHTCDPDVAIDPQNDVHTARKCDEVLL
jgi:hypothetical protein